ncbi:MAG: RNA polymerase sigma factor [Clostridiales bacterium]|jgi:RNA polymerase sigma-70 factor (ECF subfamily)|nr:RNA polymerase sigma factor [Clostridiales bacterium]
MIERLYREYHEQLLWYCINLSSNNRALAEDIVQDTFMRALENAHILNDLTNAQCRSWLYRTAKNIFIDRMRRITKEPQPQLQLTTEDDLSEVMVRQLCGQLPAEERELFWLRYMEGYNSTELGNLFDLPPSTVRARLLSARKKISKLYFEQKGKGD